MTWHGAASTDLNSNAANEKPGRSPACAPKANFRRAQLHVRIKKLGPVQRALQRVVQQFGRRVIVAVHGLRQSLRNGLHATCSVHAHSQQPWVCTAHSSGNIALPYPFALLHCCRAKLLNRLGTVALLDCCTDALTTALLHGRMASRKAACTAAHTAARTVACTAACTAAGMAARTAACTVACTAARMAVCTITCAAACTATRLRGIEHRLQHRTQAAHRRPVPSVLHGVA